MAKKATAPKTAVSGRKIYEAYSATTPVSAEAKALTKYVCNQTPILLERLLDKPVGIETFCKAKIITMKWMMSNKFPKKYTKILDGAVFGWRALHSVIISQLEAIIKNPTAYRHATGMTDDIFISKMGLDDEAIGLYTAGKLTIGQLLLLQPKIIFSND